MWVNKSLNEDQRKFVSKFMRVVVILTVLSTVVFAVVLTLAIKGKLNFTPKNVPLETIQDRLVFTLKHQSLHLAWIILLIYNVMLHRRGTPAVDPTKGFEHVTQTSKNILTNTIEHGLVFMISQLIMSVDLEPVKCARMIPVLNLLYLAGRIAFSLGYPSYRTFGFLLAHYTLVYSVGHGLYYLSKLYF